MGLPGWVYMKVTKDFVKNISLKFKNFSACPHNDVSSSSTKQQTKHLTKNDL